jgi:hypothetical protein
VSPLKRIKQSESPACTQLALSFASSLRPLAESLKDAPSQTESAKLLERETNEGSAEHEPEPEPEPKINARDRVTFEVRWDLVRPHDHFHFHTRTKRSIRDNMISWIFMHGAELSERQRCHYMTRVGGREGPHATCAFLILILHGPPSCYTSTYTCRR